MELTLAQLRHIIPQSPGLADLYLPYLNAAMVAYGIDTPARIAMFTAQIAHESGGLRYTRELWGPTPAQQRYDRRADLGNTRPEAIAIAKRNFSTPGRWWCGRGLIQITGYSNYFACGQALDRDLLDTPNLLETSRWACLSAAWFWASHHLNVPADAGDLERCTRIINGGLNGLADRQAYYTRAQEALRNAG